MKKIKLTESELIDMINNIVLSEQMMKRTEFGMEQLMKQPGRMEGGNYRRVYFNNGGSISIQASVYHYSTPRNDEGPYTRVELGFPTEGTKLPKSLLRHMEQGGNDNPYETVYPYTPVGEVNKLIKMNGGLKEGSILPPFAVKGGEQMDMGEGFFDDVFGKASVGDARDSSMRQSGTSLTGRDDSNYGEEPSKENFYIVFNGEKYYEDDIEYADYNDMGDLPRLENGKLIVGNPAWRL